MPILYKGDQECNCDNDQVAVMEKAGWSKTKEEKPKPKPVMKKVVPKKDPE